MLQRNKKDKNNKVHSVAKLKKNLIPSEISLREKSPPSSFGGLARRDNRAFLRIQVQQVIHKLLLLLMKLVPFYLK